MIYDHRPSCLSYVCLKYHVLLRPLLLKNLYQEERNEMKLVCSLFSKCPKQCVCAFACVWHHAALLSDTPTPWRNDDWAEPILRDVTACRRRCGGAAVRAPPAAAAVCLFVCLFVCIYDKQRHRMTSWTQKKRGRIYDSRLTGLFISVFMYGTASDRTCRGLMVWWFDCLTDWFDGFDG